MRYSALPRISRQNSDEKTALPIRCLSNFRETYGNIRKKASKNGKIVTKRDERSLNHIYSKSVCVKAHMGSNVKKTKVGFEPERVSA